jgi:hypothetical protein
LVLRKIGATVLALDGALSDHTLAERAMNARFGEEKSNDHANGS